MVVRMLGGADEDSMGEGLWDWWEGVRVYRITSHTNFASLPAEKDARSEPQKKAVAVCTQAGHSHLQIRLSNLHMTVR